MGKMIMPEIEKKAIKLGETVNQECNDWDNAEISIRYTSKLGGSSFMNIAMGRSAKWNAETETFHDACGTTIRCQTRTKMWVDSKKNIGLKMRGDGPYCTEMAFGSMDIEAKVRSTFGI